MRPHPQPEIIERPVPYNIEAEQAVLGSLLMDADALCRVRPLLEPSDFFRETHRWIYEALIELDKQRAPIDSLTVSDQLERMGRLGDVGGSAALTSLFMRVPTAIHAEYYATLVLCASVLRMGVGAAEEIARAAYEGKLSPDEFVALCYKVLLPLTQRASIKQDGYLSEIVPRVLDRIQQAILFDEIRGWPTGLDQLDKLTGGFVPGCLYVLAARQGTGKTSLMLQIARHSALTHGRRWLLDSLEMSEEQITACLIASQAGINSQWLKGGAMLPRHVDRHDLIEQIAEAADVIYRLPIQVVSARTPAALRAKAMATASREGLDAIGVDYLQIMSHEGSRDDNHAQRVGRTAYALKNMAMELGVAVLALGQLNQEGKKKDEPSADDVRDSGVIAEASDLFGVMWQPESKTPGKIEPLVLKVDKQRDGPTGRCWFNFDRPTGTFTDAPPPHVIAQEPPPRRQRAPTNGHHANGVSVQDMDF